MENIGYFLVSDFSCFIIYFVVVANDCFYSKINYLSVLLLLDVISEE